MENLLSPIPTGVVRDDTATLWSRTALPDKWASDSSCFFKTTLHHAQTERINVQSCVVIPSYTKTTVGTDVLPIREGLLDDLPTS